MAKHNKPAIVVFSHIVGLAVIRALGRRGIPIVVLHYQPIEVGYLSKYVRRSFTITPPTESEGRFIADIEALAGEYEGSLLVPTDDYTLVALSKSKDRLERYFRVVAGDWGIIQGVIEKQHTYELADRIGIPCPKTVVCGALDELESQARDLRFPCLIKPCEGHRFYAISRKKVLVIRGIDELRSGIRLFQDYGLKAMVQEIIPGNATAGVNYNSYFLDGEPIAEFTAEKVRLEPPFFGSPRVIVSKFIPEIIEPGRKLLKAAGFNGFSCVEFKRDARDGVYKLMEINGRHNRSGSLAVACGIDFPWIMYRDLMDGRRDSPNSFRENVYWIDLTMDLMRFFASRKAEGYSIAQYLAPYLHKHTFAILDYRDPLPFAKRCWDILKTAAAGLG